MYVPLSQQEKKKGGYVPLSQLSTSKEAVEFFAPEISAGPSFSQAKSTSAIPTGPSTVDIAKGLGQGFAQGFGAFGGELAAVPGRIRDVARGKIPDVAFGDTEFTPTGKIQEAIYGTNEPISFRKVGGSIPGIEEESVLAPAIGALLGGLDLTGVGGTKNAIKAVTLVDNFADAAKIGRQIGVQDDLIEQFANAAIIVKNDTEAKSLLDSTARLQQTTRVTPKIGQTTVQYHGTPETALTELRPSPRGTLGEGFYLTQTPERATSFSKQTKTMTGAGQVTSPKANVNVFSFDTTPLRLKVLDTIDDISGDIGGYRSMLQRQGYDGIELTKSGETVVFPESIGKLTKRETVPPIAEVKLPKKRVVDENVENLRTQIEIEKDAIADMPGKQLARFANAQGDLPEVRGTRTASGKEITEKRGMFAEQGDVIAQEILGQEVSRGGDLAVAQQLVDEYRGARKRLGELKEALKEARIEERSTRIIEKLSRQEAKLTDTLRAIEEKYPGLGKVAGGLTRKEQSVAKAGYKVGKTKARDEIITTLKVAGSIAQDTKTKIINFVKENLDVKDRGKALTLVRDAKTRKDLTKAFSRINRWAEDAEKKVIKTDILKFQKKIMDSPSVAIDYKARVKELMGDFELTGHRESTLERLKKTQEFLQTEAAKGNDIEMPRRVLHSLELLNRTPFEEITLSQLTGLKAEMELLESLGRTKFRTTESIWEIQKGKILEEVGAQGAKPLQNIELIKPEIGERLTATQKLKNLIWSIGNQAARIDKAISPMDTVFDLLDGGKGTYTGANFRFFKGQIDAGYGKYITRKSALQEPVIELATKHGLEDTNFERMGVVAAREQDGGMEKLLASGFTKEQVDSVKLSKEEQEVLDLMRSTMDSQFPEIQDTMRRVYNQPVEKVKNYFSFMTDWKAMDESEVFQRFGSQAPEQYGTPRKNVEAGYTKSRVGGDQKIKVNALDVFMQHTDNTSYLLELGETTKMLGEVATSPQYAELVGDVGQLMVREWLDVIARKGGAAGASEIAVLDTLRRNVGAGILGLKLSTVAIQPTALVDGMGFIGTKYGVKGVTNFATDSEWRKFVSNMPEIKDRLGGEFALRELTDDNWLQNIQRKGFIPLQKLDQMTAGAIAAGAYQRKMVELGEVIDFAKPFNQEALEYAQLAVRRTQSSGSFKDVPLAVSRGALTGNRSLDRAILQFQNFLLTRWSRIRHDAIRAGINTKDPKKAIPIFTAIIMAGLAGSGIRLGVNKIQDFVTGKEDEDSVVEDLSKGFMYEMTGNVPFLGTTVSMAMYDGEMFPILDAPKGVVSGLNRVITSESESAKLRGFNEFAGSTGALLGIPGSAQAEQLTRGFLQDESSSQGGGLPKKRQGGSGGLPKKRP